MIMQIILLLKPKCRLCHGI